MLLFIHVCYENVHKFVWVGCNQLETQITMMKCTNAGGRTKAANEKSIVLVHQHGRDHVTWKPPIEKL